MRRNYKTLLREYNEICGRALQAQCVNLQCVSSECTIGTELEEWRAAQTQEEQDQFWDKFAEEQIRHWAKVRTEIRETRRLRRANKRLREKLAHVTTDATA